MKISSKETIESVGNKLKCRGISLERGWEIILAMALLSCEYIEVIGYGNDAQLKMVERR